MKIDEAKAQERLGLQINRRAEAVRYRMSYIVFIAILVNPLVAIEDYSDGQPLQIAPVAT